MYSPIRNRALVARGALAAVAIVVAAATGAMAQSAPAPKSARQMLSIGPGFSGGATMLLDPAENWKVSPVFAWRLTADISYPFNDMIGAWLSVGLDRRGGGFYWYDDKELNERRMVNYFALTPGINFKGMVLGVNMGFPMSGSRTYRNGDDAVERTLELDVDVDKLLVMIEPRIMGVIPVLDSELGWLGVTVGAGYNFGDMSERRDFMPGETPGKTYSGESASAHLGLTWLFGIPGTAR